MSESRTAAPPFALTETKGKWNAGQVAPHRITTALNLRGLYGPEVDAACGVQEPDVDAWETGTLYPTWEQLLKLADLTGVHPDFFTRMDPPFSGPTTIDLHLRMPARPEPVLEFSHQALVNAGIRPGTRTFPDTSISHQNSLF